MDRRSPQFQKIFSLKIGREVSVSPAPEETLQQALARLKRRTMRYAKEGRFFRLRIDRDKVRIKRVPKGRHTKLADWLDQPVGSRLLLKTRPTEKDIRSAKSTATYLSGVWPDGKRAGFWLANIDEQGRLVAERYLDQDRNHHRGRLTRSAPVVERWGGEWL